jgi:hypothetical protein
MRNHFRGGRPRNNHPFPTAFPFLTSTQQPATSNQQPAFLVPPTTNNLQFWFNPTANTASFCLYPTPNTEPFCLSLHPRTRK